MIDINELREKITIKGLDVVADTDILAVLDRLEAAEKLNAEWLKANAPGGWIDELRAKVEAAEKERNDFAQRLVQSEQGWRKAVVERDVLRDRLALESQESGALHEAVERACEERDALRIENAALRTKIEAMEKQEPVWFIDERGEPKRYHKSKADYCKYGGLDLLYALPGAKGVPRC